MSWEKWDNFYMRLWKIYHRIWNHPVNWRALTVRLLIFAAAIAVLVFLGYLWGKHIPQVEAYIANLGVWGPIVFMALFIAAMPFFIPNAPLAMVAGALFGLWWGSVYIVIAGLIAEMMIFTAGRHWLRGYVDRWLQKHPKLLAIQAALIKKPIRLMILLRLSPIPFTPICYMMSATNVSYRDYLIGFVGYLPGNFVTVYFGFVAKHVVKAAGHSDDLSPPKLILAIVGLVATIVLITYISHVARKAVEQETHIDTKHV